MEKYYDDNWNLNSNRFLWLEAQYSGIEQRGLDHSERAKLRAQVSAKSNQDLMDAVGFSDHDPSSSGITGSEVDDQLGTHINKMVMSSLGRKEKIETDKWDEGLTTESGLAEIRRDWILLGLPAWTSEQAKEAKGQAVIEPNPYYDRIFSNLAKIHNPSYFENKVLVEELAARGTTVASLDFTTIKSNVNATPPAEDFALEWHHAGIEVGKITPSLIGTALHNAQVKEYMKLVHAKIDPLINAMKLKFQRPDQNSADIEKADPDFAQAYRFYNSVKIMAEAQTLAKAVSSERHRDENVETDLFSKGARTIGKIGGMLKDSWDRKDWGNLGMLGIGAFFIGAAFVALKKRDKLFDFLTLTAGAGTLYIIGKKLGYDPLKSLGLKDQYDEVRGTALEPLIRLAPSGKKLDAKTYLAAHNIGLHDLHNHYKNAKGRFISPKKFPHNFPEFAHKSHGAQMNNPDYIHAGEQLYLLMQCMEEAHNKVISDNPEEQTTFAAALQDPALKNVRVEDYLYSLAEYSTDGTKADYWPDRISEWWSGVGVKTEKVLAGAGIPFVRDTSDTGKWDRIKGRILNAQKDPAISGKIMGYPVIIREEKSTGLIHIYSPTQYKGEGLTSDYESMATVDMKNPEAGARTLKEKLTAKIKKTLVKSLQKLEENSQASTTNSLKLSFDKTGTDINLEYKNNKWIVGYELDGGKMKLSGEATLDLDPESLFEIKGIIEKTTGANLMGLDDVKAPGYKNMESQKKCMDALRDLTSNTTIRGGETLGIHFGVMPVADLKLMRMLLLKKPQLELNAADYEDIYDHIQNVKDALILLQATDKQVLDNLEEFTIFMGSQDLFQLFPATEGVYGFKKALSFKGDKVIAIDYDESPEKIAKKLKKYAKEAKAQ